jgi:cell volume regulation protein A
MFAGPEGAGGFAFEDYTHTFRVGTIPLVLILFDGGLNTSLSTLRRHAAPSLVLATVGVALTAALLAGGAHLFGLPWPEAALLGEIVSSTDAAAVFTVLRAGGIQLRERVGATLEIESGLNDPMAVLLTTALTTAFASGEMPRWTALGMVVLQLAIGTVVGALSGLGALVVLRRIELPGSAFYPVLTVGIAFFVFGAATLVEGSGFLAVYLAGMIIGGGRLPYRAALLRIHDFTAWVGQVAVFVLLGLLASPSRVLGVAGLGLATGLFLAFVARPIAVALCLFPLRWRPRDITYIGWVGLRGAVPIVLACIPTLARVPGAERIFDVVVFVVVVSASLQGGTVRLATTALGVGRPAGRPPPAVLEMTATRPIGQDLVVFDVHSASAVCGATLSDVPFPESAAVMLVVRGEELLAAKGNTELHEGDVVYVFCRTADRAELALLFGRHREA